MEYAWTLKVTKNDGSDQYTHLVDQGLFMKYALLHFCTHKKVFKFLGGGVGWQIGREERCALS